MSQGQQYLTPTFDTSMRGYEKKQVDRHLADTADRLAQLAAEREQAHNHIRGLSANLEQMHAELTELRDREPRLDRASFRHLGSMVDEILALSEKQGQAIVDAAGEHAAEIKNAAEKVLEAAHQEAERLRAEGQAAREATEQEAKRLHEASIAAIERAEGEARARIESAHEQTQQELAQWRSDVEREVNDHRAAAQEADELRQAESDQQMQSHQQQLSMIQKEIEARQQALSQLRNAQEQAQQQLGQLRHDGAAVEQDLAQVTHRLGVTRQELNTELSRLEHARQTAESVEQQTLEARVRMQREAKRMADRAAAAVMAAAAISEQTGEFKMVAVRPDVVAALPPAEEPVEGELVEPQPAPGSLFEPVAPPREPAAEEPRAIAMPGPVEQ
ncbi:DivIVA domain-containing protein [Asanoa sp. NPDC050611]|uniref:DivIVA domain-containing protein n=1 Tax=Asanoa sp. NPDC050611 TaxID=3157098 RepID=UPI0033CD96FA